MRNYRMEICLIRAMAICLLIAFALPLPSRAEPYFAFREGYKCSTCHVNKTGGGKRNEFGSSFTQTEFSPILEAASENALDFSTAIGESFTLGMDFMIVHETLFSVKESINEAGRNEAYEQDAANSFDIRSGNLYIEAQLLPDILTLYLDETVSPAGASNREAFILYDNLPHGGYVKAGRMLLPYGIRLWDDDSFHSPGHRIQLRQSRPRFRDWCRAGHFQRKSGLEQWNPGCSRRQHLQTDFFYRLDHY